MEDKDKKQETSETQKRKPGRPSKTPKEVLNEGERVLQMSEGPKNNNENKEITFQDVRANLTSFYNSLLGISTGVVGQGAWEGSLFNFNQYNPFLQNQRLKMLNSYPNEMSTEDLIEAVSKPGGAEITLRGEGWSLSSSQFLYYKILRMAADIPKFKYYKIPEYLTDVEDYKNNNFINEDIFLDEWLEHLDVVNTYKRMSLEVKREGKPTYLLRNSFSYGPGKKRKVNYVAFQKLPSDYVKLTGIGEHGYIASLNMLIFLNPAFSLDQYPDYIRSIWNALMETGAIYENPDYNEADNKSKDKYKINPFLISKFSYQYNGKSGTERLSGVLTTTKARGLRAVSYMYWIQLPQEVCFTFCSDSSTAWAIPDTAGLFLGLRELTDYDTLAGLIQSTPLTAVLTAEAETVNNPNPGQNQTVLSPETIAGFQDKFNNSTSTNLESFFAPLKNFKLLSLPNVPNSSDITSNATKNFVSRAGLSGLIPATDKPSVAQIKGSQLIEEAACDFVTKQFESVTNFIVNNLLGCDYKWRVNLWGNIFTYNEEVKNTKELFIAGGTFALPKLASAYNMSLRDVRAVQGYINSLDIYSNFQTITQASQIKTQETANSEESKSVGRPSLDEGEIENDNTAASKESGLDTIDMRDFNSSGRCIICGEPSDDILCEECKENYLED